MKIRSATVVLAGLAAFALMTWPALAASHSVSVGDNFYSPKTVTISVGDSVVWTSNGQAPHTVTANNGSFDSSPSCPSNISSCMQHGDTYSHTFASAGTFTYYCKVHGQAMSGTVVVGSGGSPGPSSTGPLPNTGAGSGTFIALLGGAVLLLAGGTVMFVARRRHA